MKKNIFFACVFVLFFLSSFSFCNAFNLLTDYKNNFFDVEKKFCYESINENNYCLINKVYFVDIYVEKCKLVFYSIDGNILKIYDVATPKKGVKYPKTNGKIVSIEYNPWWYPPPSFIKKGYKKPIPPSSKSNPMGKVKIKLKFENVADDTFRIHGTNNPDSIGKRASNGCVRLKNEDALELANILNSMIKFNNIININVKYI